MANTASKQALPNWGETIDTLQTLKEALSSSPLLREFEAKEARNGVTSLFKDGVTKFLVPAKHLSKQKVLKGYKENAKSSAIMVVAIADIQDVSETKAMLLDSNIQLITLPTTLAALENTIATAHSLQLRIEALEVERDEMESTSREVKHVLSISRELGGQRDIKKLLGLILSKAREVTMADAGSIYTAEIPSTDPREGKLHFRLTQNDSIKLNLSDFEVPIDEHSIVGNAVIHRSPIHIPDLYELDPDPSKNPYGAKHDRTWDDRLGYESHSMLTLPMYDISHCVVGVIQLINRKNSPKKRLKKHEDFVETVHPFTSADIEYSEIIAQQAGIALENANMQEEIQNLFDGFVNASVTAIEQRDPTTSGHSHRVCSLTLGLANVVSQQSTGEFGDIRFNADQIRELRYASLLHDFGKLGVRENVLVKAKKLYPWQYDLIRERFKLIRSNYEIDYLRQCLDFVQNPNSYPPGINIESFKAQKAEMLGKLNEYLDFIERANQPTVLEQGGFELLKDIAACHFRDLDNEVRPFLLSDELTCLSVSRGSLTADEFAEIQSHVSHTYEFLRQIPWGDKLSNVPQIAAKHHEKLDGSGYPTSASAHEIPVQSRMMTIADIFDALTASDRPYKKALPTERALDIIGMDVKGGKIDSSLFQLFVDAKVYLLTSSF